MTHRMVLRLIHVFTYNLSMFGTEQNFSLRQSKTSPER
jgi:hypothetical protein